MVNNNNNGNGNGNGNGIERVVEEEEKKKNGFIKKKFREFREAGREARMKRREEQTELKQLEREARMERTKQLEEERMTKRRKRAVEIGRRKARPIQEKIVTGVQGAFSGFGLARSFTKDLITSPEGLVTRKTKARKLKFKPTGFVSLGLPATKPPS